MGSSCRFVQPDAVTLPLSKSDSVTVRRRINTGEQRVAVRRSESGPDAPGIGLCVVIAYLLDWTFTDRSGHLVVIRDQPFDVVLAAIDALDPDDFLELRVAVNAHIVAQEQQVAADRANPSIATESSPISGSVA